MLLHPVEWWHVHLLSSVPSYSFSFTLVSFFGGDSKVEIEMHNMLISKA